MSPSFQPSHTPSMIPSVNPSESMLPSNIPSDQPSVSIIPSTSPTDMPSFFPSNDPSQLPSLLPSFMENKTEEIEYTQSLILPEGSIRFNITESELFCAIMAQYKSMDLTVDEIYVNITCKITKQQLSSGRRRYLLKKNAVNSPRNLVDVQNTILYEIKFSSRRIDVEPLPKLYQTFVNSKLTMIQEQMLSQGLNITQMLTLRTPQVLEPTPVPTPLPTPVPTPLPTDDPIAGSPVIPIPVINLSETPSEVPSSTQNKNIDNGSFIIIIATIGGGVGVLVILFIGCYFIRQKKRRQRANSKLQDVAANLRNSQLSSVPLKKDQSEFGASYPDPKKRIDVYSDGSPEDPFFGGQYQDYFEPRAGTPEDDLLPHDDSVLSNQSLISAGESQSSDSNDEEDDTSNLVDEFDIYKNKNLETMRHNVESAVSDSDAMMSQALTKALMDFDHHDTIDKNEKAFGGTYTPMEMEAAVLWDMNDWLKKKEGANIDEKRSYMQHTLNMMVASVRHGLIDPDVSSRTIHGCAAILGLELAEQIDETTLIVTGMRKTARTDDMLQAFQEFGEIENAAVAPADRGFGIVRYKNAKFAQRAVERFRTGEIVVQDVAVMIRILKSTEPKTYAPRQSVSTPSTSPMDDLFEQVETERRGNQYK